MRKSRLPERRWWPRWRRRRGRCCGRDHDAIAWHTYACAVCRAARPEYLPPLPRHNPSTVLSHPGRRIEKPAGLIPPAHRLEERMVTHLLLLLLIVVTLGVEVKI